jgi:SAM-dependent methyltransferase
MQTEIKTAVKDKYGAVARSGLSSKHAGSHKIAEAFGYTAEDLASIPAEANMGLSCGNPTAMASLKPGEVVLDLGCGGGLDVFLAAQKVGSAGRAIGVDMTESMIERARANAARVGARNVEFHLAEIENLPLANASVDCIISNCVINLVPDKRRAFAEMFRVLKPGGRVAVSDIALKQSLPAELAADVAAYVGCIAGAVPIDDYVADLESAGFQEVQVIDSGADLYAYAQMDDQAGCCAPAVVEIDGAKSSSCCCGSGPADETLHQRLAELLKKYNVNDYAASVRVFALRP